ncbi:MAG: MFS transporter [Paludibacteraceae bacterium]|nr:MFS transporter [Paludibacteraceae bacterium]
MVQSKTQSSNVLTIIIMFFLFGMISFVTGMQDPFGVIVRAQFKATNAMSQLGNAANFIAYACMGLPAGMLLKRYGYKVTSLLAVGIGFIGVCITFLSGHLASFGVYLTGAFVSGFSMCMLNSIVNPMLNTLGGGGSRGNQLVQWGGSCNSLNATIVPILIGYLIGTVSKDTQITDANPALFIAMGIFAFAFIVLCFAHIPEPELEAARARMERADQQESMGQAICATLRYRHLVLGMLAVWLYVGMEVTIANVTNLYLTSPEVGVLPSVSGIIVGSYWFLMLCGRLTGGLVGGKISSRSMLTAVSVVGAVLLIVGMIVGDHSTVAFPAIDKNTFTFITQQIPTGAMCFVLCGFCTSIMWGAIFNLSVKGLGEHTSIASGLFMMMVFGGGILPIVQSHLADRMGFIPSYIVPLIAMLYILWYALFGSREKQI